MNGKATKWGSKVVVSLETKREAAELLSLDTEERQREDALAR